MNITIFNINFHLFELPFIVFLFSACMWQILRDGFCISITGGKYVRIFYINIIIYIIFVQLSIINAVTPILIFKSVLKWVEILLVTSLVFFYVSNYKRYKIIYWFLFWFNFSWIALLYLQIAIGNESLFSYRIFHSTESVLAYGILLPIYMKEFHKRFWLLLLLAIIAVLLSLARNAYLSAAIVTFLTLVQFKRKKNNTVYILLPFLVIFIFLIVNYPEIFDRWKMFFSMQMGSNKERWTLLLLGINTFFQYPLFGVGSLNFPSYYEKFGIPFNYATDRFLLPNPHNTFVQVAAEEGVFALIAFSSLIFIGFYLVYREQKQIIVNKAYLCGIQNVYIILFVTMFFAYISFHLRINLAVIWGLALALLRFNDQQLTSKRETEENA